MLVLHRTGRRHDGGPGAIAAAQVAIDRCAVEGLEALPVCPE